MNWCCAAVSIGEQLPEKGFVRPKHVAIDCESKKKLNSVAFNPQGNYTYQATAAYRRS
jgi:hypothetical protein